MRGKRWQFVVGEGSGGGGGEKIMGRTVPVSLLVLILAGLVVACGGATPALYPTPTLVPPTPTESLLLTGVEKLGETIAEMRGAPALQLQTLLELDSEGFRRLQREAPEALAMMVLQWLGEVTEGLEPDYRPYAIEALLEEQFGIRDPRVIDPLVDAILEDRIEITRTAVVEPTPAHYAASGWETIFDPHSGWTVDYPTDKWQLDDRTLSHLSIPGCTLWVFSGGTEVPFEWEIREYDAPIRMGQHLFLKRTWAVSSTAAPRLVAYSLDEPGRDILFHLLGSPGLDDEPGDFAVCQEDAEAVMAALITH